MTPPDDLLARRIASHLGQQPVVGEHVAVRLADARAEALAKARAIREATSQGLTASGKLANLPLPFFSRH